MSSEKNQKLKIKNQKSKKQIPRGHELHPENEIVQSRKERKGPVAYAYLH